MAQIQQMHASIAHTQILFNFFTLISFTLVLYVQVQTAVDRDPIESTKGNREPNKELRSLTRGYAKHSWALSLF